MSRKICGSSGAFIAVNADGYFADEFAESIGRAPKNLMNIEIPDLHQIILDASQLDPKEAQIIAAIAQGQLDLLTQHWTKIKDIRDSDPKSEISISLSSSVNSSGPQPLVLTKIAYAQKFTDEREGYVDDGRQGRLFGKS